MAWPSRQRDVRRPIRPLPRYHHRPPRPHHLRQHPARRVAVRLCQWLDVESIRRSHDHVSVAATSCHCHVASVDAAGATTRWRASPHNLQPQWRAPSKASCAFGPVSGASCAIRARGQSDYAARQPTRMVSATGTTTRKSPRAVPRPGHPRRTRRRREFHHQRTASGCR